MTCVAAKLAMQRVEALERQVDEIRRTQVAIEILDVDRVRIRRLERFVEALLGWELDYLDDINDIRALLFRLQREWRNNEGTTK